MDCKFKIGLFSWFCGILVLRNYNSILLNDRIITDSKKLVQIQWGRLEIEIDKKNQNWCFQILRFFLLGKLEFETVIYYIRRKFNVQFSSKGKSIELNNVFIKNLQIREHKTYFEGCNRFSISHHEKSCTFAGSRLQPPDESSRIALLQFSARHW